MIRTRAKLAQLQIAADQALEHVPLLHRLVLATMLQSLFSIITDLTEEIDKLKTMGGSST